jgi:alkaline phosphatase D
VLGPPGKRVQIILLDTRYFRSPLNKPKEKASHEPGEGFAGPYRPTPDPEATVLGPEQWKWLAEQLRVPAEVRILASSIQAIAHEHGWEHWGNFPRERERLFKLIADTHAQGVVIISGDRHSAEISKHDPGVGYALYDVTSSSLNQPSKWHNEINRYRIGTKYVEANFGAVLIDWEEADPTIRLQVRTEKGDVALQQRVRLSELRHK